MSDTEPLRIVSGSQFQDSTTYGDAGSLLFCAISAFLPLLVVEEAIMRRNRRHEAGAAEAAHTVGSPEGTGRNGNWHYITY
jgi:hypothetical protein